MKLFFIRLAFVLTGLFCVGFNAYNIYNITRLPFTGETATAKVTGYKISRNGAKKVQNPSSISKPLSGRSPWFDFKTSDNQAISTYSHALSVFVFFNYNIGDDIKVAYPKDAPEQAVILHWKEFPGMIFMMLFGVLCIYMAFVFDKK